MTSNRPAGRSSARDLAVAAAGLARADNCEDILVLDLRGISPVTDFFVICTGTSDRQIRSVAENLADYAKSIGQRVWHEAGAESAEWIVMDFVDVVVHLFDQAHRKYYDLELIWGEAPRIDWQQQMPADTTERTD